jgi:hypothetical protein
LAPIVTRSVDQSTPAFPRGSSNVEHDASRDDVPYLFLFVLMLMEILSVR